MLECSEVVFAYGQRVILDCITVRLERPEIVGLTGANGSGKTTLLSILSGRLRPSAGKICWKGEDVTRLSLPARARLGLGFLPQSPSILGSATVAQNLAFVAEMTGADASVDHLLERFGLASLRGQRAGLLSGGERRRLELARAVLGRTEVLLLDEPFAGLDVAAIASVEALLLELARQHPILLSDHNADLLARLTSRGYRLVSGKLEAED